jgi:hypothetical protein
MMLFCSLKSITFIVLWFIVICFSCRRLVQSYKKLRGIPNFGEAKTNRSFRIRVTFLQTAISSLRKKSTRKDKKDAQKCKKQTRKQLISQLFTNFAPEKTNVAWLLSNA